MCRWVVNHCRPEMKFNGDLPMGVVALKQVSKFILYYFRKWKL